MDFTKEDFSHRLAALRTERGWNQSQLSEKSGVSKESIANYESCRSIPNLFIACKLADALECSLETLSGRVPLLEER